MLVNVQDSCLHVEEKVSAAARRDRLCDIERVVTLRRVDTCNSRN